MDSQKIVRVPGSINAASIIEFVMGAFACISGLAIIAVIRKPQILERVLTKALEELAKRGTTFPRQIDQALIVKVAVYLAIIMITWGAIDIIIGWGLRNLRRWAGILAIISGVLGILAGFGKDILGFIINLTVVILIVSGWNSLK